MPHCLTIQEFSTLIDDGRIFTVTFTKRTTGERRVMNCRRGVFKNVNGTGRAFEPQAKALLPVWDMQANGHRMVPLDGLIALSMQGRSYAWAGDAFTETTDLAA